MILSAVVSRTIAGNVVRPNLVGPMNGAFAHISIHSTRPPFSEHSAKPHAIARLTI